MDTIDFTEAQIKQYVERKRPKDIEIRKQIDIGYTFDGRSLKIHEIRPQWDDPKIIHGYSNIKATYVKSQNFWKLYWKRASGKWEAYDPNPEVKTIQEVLQIIDEDSHGCFWG